MALCLGKDKFLKITDRTVPEICARNNNVKRLSIIYLCWMLKEIGVDLIEIDANSFKRLGKLPKGIEFIYRVQSEEDIETLAKSRVKYSIIKESDISLDLFKKMKGLNTNNTLEFKAESFKELRVISKLKDYCEAGSIHSIRITGLKKFTSSEWLDAVKKIIKKTNIDIDLCPQNQYYNAVAAVIEGVMGGISQVTASFTGIGDDGGYAALEEVMAAVKVLVNPGMKINLELLPELSKNFAKMSHIVVPRTKPVIGKDIFAYESGIHADGIEKNPSTYEPFEPQMVGLKRKLAIGKHSGKKAVIKKLRELEVEFNEDEIEGILETIRSKSIKFRRNLRDEEIKEICSSGSLFQYLIAGSP